MTPITEKDVKIGILTRQRDAYLAALRDVQRVAGRTEMSMMAMGKQILELRAIVVNILGGKRR